MVAHKHTSQRVISDKCIINLFAIYQYRNLDVGLGEEIDMLSLLAQQFGKIN